MSSYLSVFVGVTPFSHLVGGSLVNVPVHLLARFPLAALSQEKFSQNGL